MWVYIVNMFLKIEYIFNYSYHKIIIILYHFKIKNKHGSHSNTQNKTFRCAKGERNHIAYLTRKI